MKKNKLLIYLAILLYLVSNSCIKEEKSYTDELYLKYKSQKGFLILDIPPRILASFLGSNNESKELKKVVSEFEKIKVLIFHLQDDENISKEKLFNEFSNYYRNRKFEEKAIKNDSIDKVLVVLKNNRKKLGEMIVLIHSEDAFMSISLKGLFDENTIAILIKDENLEIVKKIYKNN